MGKRLAVLSLPCVLLVALALPGPILAAAKFSYTVERDVCKAGAGKYGFGHAALRVRIIEYGKSGANRFTYKAQVWKRPLHSRKWTKEYQWPRYETTFPNNYDSYYNSRAYSYDPKRNVYLRIVVTVRAWHGDERLFSRTVYGKIC